MDFGSRAGCVLLGWSDRNYEEMKVGRGDRFWILEVVQVSVVGVERSVASMIALVERKLKGEGDPATELSEDLAG